MIRAPRMRACGNSRALLWFVADASRGITLSLGRPAGPCLRWSLRCGRIGGRRSYENVKDMYRHVEEMIDEFSGGKLSPAAKQRRVKSLFTRCARDARVGALRTGAVTAPGAVRA